MGKKIKSSLASAAKARTGGICHACGGPPEPDAEGNCAICSVYLAPRSIRVTGTNHRQVAEVGERLLPLMSPKTLTKDREKRSVSQRSGKKDIMSSEKHESKVKILDGVGALSRKPKAADRFRAKPEGTPRVLISYSHDSSTHAYRVARLANGLRTGGINVVLDQFVETQVPPDGWPKWMERQIEEADFVLMICTPTYVRRFSGKEKPKRGLGATWEGLVITQHIYDDAGRNVKFIPVFLEGKQAELPSVLRATTKYSLPSDYEKLYRRLTKQSAVVAVPIGKMRRLQPKAMGGVDKGKIIADAADSGRLLWRLPRGFLVLDDLLPRSYSSWATTICYYGEDGECRQGTHFHSSYENSWNSLGGLETQCAKLKIPYGDWYLAMPALDLIMDMRSGSAKPLEKVAATLRKEGVPVWHIKAGKPVRWVPVPANYEIDVATSELRDIVEHIRYLSLVEDPKAKASFRYVRWGDLRHTALLAATEHLGLGHPSVEAVQKIVNNFRSDWDEAELRAWTDELASALSAILRYLRKKSGSVS